MQYHRVDIALDTFPYNGVTTTCEALWMGVPVVSRVGPTHGARQGLTLLDAAGVRELAVGAEGYVRACASLAADPDRLSQLRAGLRDRMRRSSLMDEAAFARKMEAAYRRAWAAWCATQGRAEAGN